MSSPVLSVTKLFNLSLHSGQLPVVPATSLNNYWPTSPVRPEGYWALGLEQEQVNAEELNSLFQLPTLSSRCSYFKLLTTFKFLNGLLYCPPDLFVFNASPNTRVSHSTQLAVPFAKTAAYFCKYY